MRTLPFANLRTLSNRDLALVLVNLLICIAVMVWTGLQDIAGGPQNYFNAMVYFGITAYSTLEARWSKQSGDSRNADLWFNCAWVCSAAGVVHHTFWLLLWPTLPESFQVFGGVITPVLCATAVLVLIVRCKKISPASQVDDQGEPFDLGMIGFSLLASMLFVWTETTHSDMAWSWISAERPQSLALPSLGLGWLVFSGLLVFRLWGMYKLAVKNLPWLALDKALLTLAGLAMAATGMQLFWHSPAFNMEVILYGSTLILWGGLQAVLALLSTRICTSNGTRNTIAIVAIGLHIGTCLIPGNIYKLVQMDVTAAQALAYVLNNALFTMGLYFGMNGFGVKVYFLKKLKGFRMRYLGFKN
jgi:hypothetical protein